MTARSACLAQLAATPLLLWTGACMMTDSCVAAGSRVATPGGWVRIEALRPGDEIYAVDVATGGLVATVVTAVRVGHRECVALVGPHGPRLRLTPDHPVYAPEHAGFVAAGRLVLGQTNHALVFAAVEPGARAEVVALADRDTDAGVHPVYDLTVAGAHPTFVAEGFVVHNKSYDPSSSTSLETGGDPPTTGRSESTTTSTGTTDSSGEPTTGSSGEPTTTTTGTTEAASSSGADTDAPLFACGRLDCVTADEYCEVFHPGREGDTSYTCQPLPAACQPQPDCMCLAAQAIAGECSETPEGGLRVEIFGA